MCKCQYSQVPLQRRQAANTGKLWGVGSPKQQAWKGYPEPKQHIPNILIMHLTW